jgi:hypothetical protein
MKLRKELDLIASASNPAQEVRSTPKSGGSPKTLLFLGGSAKSGDASRAVTEAPPSLRPLLASPRQTCHLLCISMSALYELLNAGKLESFKLGGSRKITVVSIERFVAEKAARGLCPAATGR